jgi:hypothetical protein
MTNLENKRNDLIDENKEGFEDSSNLQSFEVPVKKARGRPRKSSTVKAEVPSEVSIQRPRRRPRKTITTANPVVQGSPEVLNLSFPIETRTLFLEEIPSLQKHDGRKTFQIPQNLKVESLAVVEGFINIDKALKYDSIDLPGERRLNLENGFLFKVNSKIAEGEFLPKPSLLRINERKRERKKSFHISKKIEISKIF